MLIENFPALGYAERVAVMNTAALDAGLPWLRTVTSVHAEPIELTEPFVDVVRRFAAVPGTVALLSGGQLDCARYHILGVYPWLSLSGQRTRTTLVDGDRRVELEEDPFSTLRRVLQHCSMPALGASLPLSSGLLGYLAYDLKDCLEQLPRTSIDDLELPLMRLVAPTIIVIHDRVSEATTLLAMRLQGETAAYLEHVARFKAALAAAGAARAAETSDRQVCVGLFACGVPLGDRGDPRVHRRG